MLLLLLACLSHASSEPSEPPTGCLPDTASLAADPRLAGDAVVVWKEQRRLQHFQQGVSQGCWPVALAFGYPEGPKRVEGDKKTPEGWYRTSDKPSSSFYAAVAVHYPNADDAEAGRALLSEAQHDAITEALAKDHKPPQATPLGGEILIHGGGSLRDWTLGCIALEDGDIDALRAQLPAGMRTDLLILP